MSWCRAASSLSRQQPSRATAAGEVASVQPPPSGAGGGPTVGGTLAESMAAMLEKRRNPGLRTKLDDDAASSDAPRCTLENRLWENKTDVSSVVQQKLNYCKKIKTFIRSQII